MSVLLGGGGEHLGVAFYRPEQRLHVDDEPFSPIRCAIRCAAACADRGLDTVDCHVRLKR